MSSVGISPPFTVLPVQRAGGSTIRYRRLCGMVGIIFHTCSLILPGARKCGETQKASVTAEREGLLINEPASITEYAVRQEVVSAWKRLVLGDLLR